jgi:hypothetical protein
LQRDRFAATRATDLHAGAKFRLNAETEQTVHRNRSESQETSSGMATPRRLSAVRRALVSVRVRSSAGVHLLLQSGCD